MTPNKILAAGAVFAFLGVAAGAFGAHGLRDHLSADHMSIYQTGVQYQLVHAIGLVTLGAQERLNARVPAWLFIAGIIIFSGSLYALAITGTTWWGAITPLGGVAFLAGWALLAWRALAAKKL